MPASGIGGGNGGRDGLTARKKTHSRRRRREESQISSEIKPESETRYLVSYFLNGLLARSVIKKLSDQI